ncbi:hypothetical protein VPH35_015600 [Triticum aestivum]
MHEHDVSHTSTCLGFFSVCSRWKPEASLSSTRITMARLKTASWQVLPFDFSIVRLWIISPLLADTKYRKFCDQIRNTDTKRPANGLHSTRFLLEASLTAKLEIHIYGHWNRSHKTTEACVVTNLPWAISKEKTRYIHRSAN